MTDDLARLQGTWTVVSLETEGTKMGDAFIGGGRIIVKGSTFTTISMGAKYKGTIAIDASKTPKTLDMHFTAGPSKGTTGRAIYDLKGDTWKLCLTMRDVPRPKAFKTAKGSGLALETLTREDPKTPGRSSGIAKPATPVISVVAPARILGSVKTTEIEGEWAMVSHVKDGKPLAAPMVAYCRRETRGNETTVFAATQVMMHARFTIDAKASPKRIDYFDAKKIGGTPVQLGIYELDGDRLIISMGKSGGARPKDFSAKKGDGRLVTKWTRALKN